MKLNNQELLCIVGGSVTAALVSAVVKVFTTIMDFGRKVGSTIRRGISRNYC